MTCDQIRDGRWTIPQYSRKTASLNVAVAGSIVLQHFALFAGFEAAPISGEKFEVEEARSKLDRFQNPTADEMEIIRRKRAERGAAKRARADESRDAEFFPSDLEEAARSRTGSGSAVGCRRDEVRPRDECCDNRSPKEAKVLKNDAKHHMIWTPEDPAMASRETAESTSCSLGRPASANGGG